MLEFKEVKITRILNPTSIDLGEYVINPFLGCEFACLYCYVRCNRVISRKTKPWGEYVDIRVNAPYLLEKEIISKRPKSVLLGSTTECFQPVERKYQLTKRLLEILNQHKVYYTILTRSPDILNYLPLLKEGFCKRIYFTVNKFQPEFKRWLEPKSPNLLLRDKAVDTLLEEGLPVVPYFSPLFPGISDTKGVFLRFQKAKTIEFEGLNFRLNNLQAIIENISMIAPHLKEKYARMLNDRVFYLKTWKIIEAEIKKEAKKAGKGYNIYFHPAPACRGGVHGFGDYFKNTY